MKNGKSLRKMQKQTNEYIQRENAKFGPQFVQIPREAWPRIEPGKTPDALWRNRDYVVLVYCEKNGITRLSICRTAVTIQGRWADGIDWEALQFIKSQVGFGDLDAVEVFPKDKDVTNVANMRHLWVLPEELAFAWRA